MGFVSEAQGYLFLVIYGVVMPVTAAFTATKAIRGIINGLFGRVVALIGGVLAAMLVSLIAYGTVYLIVGVAVPLETLALVAAIPCIAGAAVGVIWKS